MTSELLQDRVVLPSPLPAKVNIGCGYDKRPGYLNVDVDPACNPDVLTRDNDLSILPQGHFEEVLAHDVLEHIPRAFTQAAILDWAALLKPGGTLALQTSSILGVAELMQRNDNFEFQFNWTGCLFGNQQHSGDFHHSGFTEKTLRVHLQSAGFEEPQFKTCDGWLLSASVRKIHDWTDLLRSMTQSSDEEFLSAAYQQMYGREVDFTGTSHYLPLIQQTSRQQALRAIAASPERLYRVARELGI